jgi:hypothetical protein
MYDYVQALQIFIKKNHTHEQGMRINVPKILAKNPIKK